MKKLSLLFGMILCIAVPELPAQRYLPGMRGVQFTTGTINGLNPEMGFHTGMAIATYTKHADRWVVGFEYLEKRHTYKDLKIPQSQFTLEAGYFLKFLSDWRKTFFAAIGASAMAGYETVNWNDKLLIDGATIHNRDVFLYGGALTLEVETYLTDRLVLLTNVRERFMPSSSIGKLNTQFGLGLRFMIN